MNHLYKFISESHINDYYHFTSIGSLLSIIKSNIFKLSNLESHRNKGYKYFMSLTRSKYSKKGYARSLFNCNVRIVFDDKLNNAFKIKPIDFFPKSKNLAIKSEYEGWEENNKEGQQYVEAEERLFSNKEKIEKVYKYIKQIDINKETLDEGDIDFLIPYTRLYNIYIYHSNEDFALQKNGILL